MLKKNNSEAGFNALISLYLESRVEKKAITIEEDERDCERIHYWSQKCILYSSSFKYQ